MSTATKAEEFVKEWYEAKGMSVVRVKRPETGFDFQTRDGNSYIEVKGTAENKLSQVLFRYLTNSEYERIKWCLRNEKQYWLHLLTGVGSEDIKHYRIPGEFVLRNAKPEISWMLPIRKSLADFEVPAP
jgi:hypothetical protein